MLEKSKQLMKDVLNLKKQGLSYRQIANSLNISYSTAYFWSNYKRQRRKTLERKKRNKKLYNKDFDYTDIFKGKEVLSDQELFESMAY